MFVTTHPNHGSILYAMGYNHLSVLFVIVGTVAGYLITGSEGAVLGAFIGYFLGKIIESLWRVVGI